MKLHIAAIAAIGAALVFAGPAAAQPAKSNVTCKLETTIVKGRKVARKVCAPSTHKAAVSKTQKKPSGRKP
ncbi:hypothetical protein [Neorhizobium sp. NCHU2750]|uniref:hypothetical protein n=1 Tax=Neorhizobium sp. NCHU2750 TaxID=1825976 RepID=UPI000E70BB66|nr:hypothetical protein NCHU2750_15640 [Neorhizobium sp. NCHU2750]